MSKMDGNTGLRRKDTTKGPPLRILSLDGGGVRGYSVFIILQELMHRTFVEIEGRAPKRSEIPKPCDQFDLIVGTGTGGLIAIMLGRLRLDLETCKEVYVRMTRKVFETDKTIAGIPYRSTLFKASKLEEAIKECVKEHTIFQSEGNDGEAFDDVQTPVGRPSGGVHRHQSNASIMSFSARSPTPSYSSRQWPAPSRWGNPDALLYDTRENRTKTAVTAVYKGTPKNGAPALLRSYDSRKEPAPEFDCTIWQAGRATSATGLAFKPIQVGQSMFIDEGHGRFNPAPLVLDEATVNEYPGRDVGVFVSLGTGKRPASSDAQSHLWYDDILGDFAEARRRLIAKIEGCEATHRAMLTEHLPRRGVNTENYYRLNVEVGVGDFGMNEWSRLADISTSTRRYLARPDVQTMTLDAAAKLARIALAKQRADSAPRGSSAPSRPRRGLPAVKESDRPAAATPYPTFAAELEADVPPTPQSGSFPSSRPSYDYNGRPDSLHVQRTSPSPPVSAASAGSSARGDSPALAAADRFTAHAPTPAQFRSSGDSATLPMAGLWLDEFPMPPREAPPVPPKTPIPGEAARRESRRVQKVLPYPLDDGPPPVVDMARKPEWNGR